MGRVAGSVQVHRRCRNAQLLRQLIRVFLGLPLTTRPVPWACLHEVSSLDFSSFHSKSMLFFFISVPFLVCFISWEQDGNLSFFKLLSVFSFCNFTENLEEDTEVSHMAFVSPHAQLPSWLSASPPSCDCGFVSVAVVKYSEKKRLEVHQ